MSKKIVVSAGLLAKSQVAAYTRKDGTMVQAHDNGRQAAAKKPIPPHVQKMVSDVAQSSAKPEHKKAAIDAIVAQHADAPADGGGAKKVGVRKSVAKPAVAPAKPDWKSAHEDAESELAVASYRGGGKEKAVAALNKAADLHRAAAKRQAPGDMSPDFHNAHADKLAALAKDHGGGSDEERRPTQKTGSAAPAKSVNIGTEKWPLHAKSSEKLAAKRDDGSTHHVGGFEPPSTGKGDHIVHHDGKAFSFTGKSGKNMKTGEASYEYSHKDDAKGVESRAWVTHSGHLMND